MHILSQIDEWGKKHHPLWIEFMRIALGLILILKGFYFVQNSTALVTLLENKHFGQWAMATAYILPFINLLGGVLLVVGLITRVALLCELPILIIAVFFVNGSEGFYNGNSELLFSVIVLMLIIFFLVEGPGTLSLDFHIRAGRMRNARDKLIRNAFPGSGHTNPDGE